MKEHQRQFIQLAIDAGALGFGEFILKSGRQSPYFFNAGKFQMGTSLRILGHCFTQTIIESGIQFDVLFGPAYKGIPLASVTAAALAEAGHDVAYAFNRKEAKAHGEGGSIVGAPLTGRVLVIDDVMTAGTAINESVEIIQANQATLAGVIIALDRQERGQGSQSAVQEVAARYDVPVHAIVGLADIMQHLAADSSEPAQLVTIERYYQEYGVQY